MLKRYLTLREKESDTPTNDGQDRLEFEKGDIKAIIIAAIITFVPLLLFLAIPLVLAWWIFVGRF
ncbi:MAG: hypothetical protein FWB91_06825 [Defluviitaleaceae bacterium]|nr:hypothetical protein [Defluviitaleaceae bacterium]